MPEPTLFFKPQQVLFGPGQLEELRTYLTKQEDTTVIYDLDDVRMLTLDENGRTEIHGCQLSLLCLFQLCKTLGAGLYSVLCDLSGNRRQRVNTPPECFSQADAIFIFNTVVKRRFRTLSNGQLTRSAGSTIDCMTSSVTYARLANIDFLEMILTAMEASADNFTFHSATVVGRWLTVYFTSPEEFEAGPGDAWRQALYFANSEAADRSVRGVACMHRCFDNTRVMRTFSNYGRLRHASAKLYRQVGKMINTVAAYRIEPDWFTARVKRLRLMSLGLTGRDEDADDDALHRLEHYCKRCMYGSARFFDKAIHGALVQASMDAKPTDSVAYTRRHEWSERNMYDVFCAALRMAEIQAITLRERIEQSAFKVLSSERTLAIT